MYTQISSTRPRATERQAAGLQTHPAISLQLHLLRNLSGAAGGPIRGLAAKSAFSNFWPLTLARRGVRAADSVRATVAFRERPGVPYSPGGAAQQAFSQSPACVWRVKTPHPFRSNPFSLKGAGDIEAKGLI